ncbi:GNAT family N-acetyltransferase [Planctomycetota bacterium]
MVTSVSNIQVRPISSDEIPIALELFKNSGRKSDWDKLFGLMLDEQLAGSGLLVADQDGQVVGAVWGALLTATMAQVIAPACEQDYSSSERTTIEVALLEAAIEHLQNMGARFVTIAVETSDRHDTALLAARFEFAANVQSMVRPLFPVGESASITLDANSQLQFSSPRDRNDLAVLIAETFRGSLDCPIVNDYRTADDFLESYGAEQGTDPEGWFVAVHRGINVGCVLIDVAGTQAEITYLGVASSYRGKGCGRALLDFGQRYATRRGATTITADVDSKNSYAIAIYQQAGYVAYDFNRVFVANIPRKKDSSSP